MNFSFLLQFALHGLCEWAAAFAIAFWISQAWAQSPAPALVQLVRSPLRPWLMAAFGIAPPILSLLLQPLLIKIYTSGAGLGAQIPLSYFLSLIYGVLVGLAASCCVAPATAEQEFRPGPPAAISAVLIFVSFLLGSLLRFQFIVHTLGGITVALVVLFIARWMIAAETPPALPTEQPVTTPVQRALWPALIIGFLPAALVMATIAVASAMNLGREASNALLWLCSIVSGICCFAASILLFKRHTGRAMAGGILLLLLNAFIAFFFGCCAAISNSGFR